MKKSLFEELIEDLEQDKKIVKSFKQKDVLCPLIFEKNGEEYHLIEDIGKKLLAISDNFLTFLGVEFFVYDILLTGSLANFNWSKFSDVDLHIVINFEESTHNIDLLKEFFDAKKNNWNKSHDIKIKGHDVEIYVQDSNEKHISSGVYSILNKEWIVKPSKTDANIDDRKIIEKAEEFINNVDELENKSDEGEDISSLVTQLSKKIKGFRQSGLENGGEYSYENLVFKLLRRNGYMEKLLKLRTAQTDKKLSIPQ